jgi:hypothetical protein
VFESILSTAALDKAAASASNINPAAPFAGLPMPFLQIDALAFKTLVTPIMLQ